MTELYQYSYPFGYVYFNEAFVWQPVAFVYSILLSGADLFILAALAYLTRRMTQLIPVFLLTGLSFFSVVLLGPLADVTQPRRAWRVLFDPHLFSTATHPGVSVMAVYGGVLWITTLVVGALATYLYAKRKKLAPQMDGSDIYMKVVFVAVIVCSLTWTIYPSTLFVNETWRWSWRMWGMLPAMFFIETFITATASAIIVGRIFNKRHDNLLLFIHSVAAFALIFLVVVQLVFWALQTRGTSFMAIYSLYPLFGVASVIFLITAILSLRAIVHGRGITFVGILALIGVVINKWNIIINGQLVSATGMGRVELHLQKWWLLETLSPVALAILILLALSSIYPLRGGDHGAYN